MNGQTELLHGIHYRNRGRRTKMIDEKKLIAEIREKIYPEKFGERCNSLDVIYAILQLIDEQPKVNEWIPCSEKLPKNDYDTVMVFLDSKIYDIAIWHNEHGFRPWYAAHFEASPPEWKACVTAWMPLPEL